MVVGFVRLPRFFAEVEGGSKDRGPTAGTAVATKVAPTTTVSPQSSVLGPWSTIIAVHRRGRVVSLSAEAEGGGLKVGMRLREAQAIGPKVEFIPFVEDHYPAAWRRVLDICAAHLSIIEPVGLGEAFVDLSAPTTAMSVAERPTYANGNGGRVPRLQDAPTTAFMVAWNPAQVLDGIRRDIEAQMRFTCLVGGGPSKLVARVAAEMEPGRVVAAEEAAGFLAPLPIEKLGTEKGMEPLSADVCEKRLRPFFCTIGLLQRVPAARLAEQFGWEARRLAELARGIDHSPVQPLYPPRTLAVRLTLPGGVSHTEAIDFGLRKLSVRIGEELAKRQEACCQMSLRLKSEGMSDLVRSMRLRRPAMKGEEVLRACRHLFSRLKIATPVTALVIEASDFRRCTSRQLEMFAYSGKWSSPIFGSAAAENGPVPFSQAQEALTSVQEHFGLQAAITAAEIEVPRRERMLAMV